MNPNNDNWPFEHTYRIEAYYGPCPQCKGTASVNVKTMYHKGYLDDTSFITIDCPDCNYHDYYQIAKDN